MFLDTLAVVFLGFLFRQVHGYPFVIGELQATAVVAKMLLQGWAATFPGQDVDLLLKLWLDVNLSRLSCIDGASPCRLKSFTKYGGAAVKNRKNALSVELALLCAGQ